MGLADVHHWRVHTTEAEHRGVGSGKTREILQKQLLQGIEGMAAIGLEKTGRQPLLSDLLRKLPILIGCKLFI